MSAEEYFDLVDHVEPDFADICRDVHPRKSSRSESDNKRFMRQDTVPPDTVNNTLDLDSPPDPEPGIDQTPRGLDTADDVHDVNKPLDDDIQSTRLDAATSAILLNPWMQQHERPDHHQLYRPMLIRLWGCIMIGPSHNT